MKMGTRGEKIEGRDENDEEEGKMRRMRKN